MLGREKRNWWWTILLVVLLSSVACRSGVVSPPEREEERMLALLSMARSQHRLASIKSREGKHNKALLHVDQILKLQFPRGFRPGEEMLLDAWSRKAKMQMKLK